jgi:SAM-dependent methyltransferase
MVDPSDGTKVFDEVAARYARFRPDYQPALIDGIVSLSGLPSGGRILEIGCGPGEATLPFAQRGYAMLCLDPGPRLVALARERLRDYPAVQFAVATFEDWPLEEGAFDLVMAASAFHWIREGVGFPKAAAALNDTGAIALFRNARQTDDTPLYREIQRAYARYAPELARGRDHQRGRSSEDIAASGLFGDVVTCHHPWTQTYTAQEYVDLLDTYSGHRRLPTAQRAALFAAITAAIDRHGGTIDVPWVGTAQVAHKRVR